MLIEKLNVTLADLMPMKGKSVLVTLRNERTPYRVSERLHQAARDLAKEEGILLTNLLAALRDEINQQGE